MKVTGKHKSPLQQGFLCAVGMANATSYPYPASV
uniref:Uncharacterized protein n=1 Tax=Anguilla anguilla TaxID=7936 RepID=A0A0E9S3W2_ANGAN